MMIPSRRCYHCVSSCFPNVLGGLETSETYRSAASASCHAYNVSKSKWITLPNYPQPLHSHALCYDGARYLYSIGGLGSQEQVLADCYKCDVTSLSDGWRPVALGIEPVYSHTTHVVNNKLLIVGGIGHRGDQLGIQVAHLLDNVCEHIALPVGGDSGGLNMYFNHTTHVVLENGEDPVLLVFGGGGNCFSFGTHINAHISKHTLKL